MVMQDNNQWHRNEFESGGEAPEKFLFGRAPPLFWL